MKRGKSYGPNKWYISLRSINEVEHMQNVLEEKEIYFKIRKFCTIEDCHIPGRPYALVFDHTTLYGPDCHPFEDLRAEITKYRTEEKNYMKILTGLASACEGPKDVDTLLRLWQKMLEKEKEDSNAEA